MKSVRIFAIVKAKDLTDDTNIPMCGENSKRVLLLSHTSRHTNYKDADEPLQKDGQVSVLSFYYPEQPIMKQIKVEHKENFTTVSNQFIRDKNLSLKAKGLLLTILSLNDKEWDFSIKGLCSICKESKSAIYSAIDELIENHYCFRKQDQTNNGRFLPVTYTFYEEPFTENKDAVNENADNQPQLNNNIIKYQYNKQSNNLSLLETDENAETANYDSADSFEEVWKDWCDYAKEQHNTKSKMLKCQRETLIEYTQGNATLAKKIIKRAINNGFKMFIPPKDEDNIKEIHTDNNWE